MDGKKMNTLTIDAAGRTPGRVASEAARHLMGKNSAGFEKHHMPQTRVKVINAGRLRISDKKKKGVWYIRHTHFPGGIKREELGEVIEKKGQSEVIKRAVRGMIPANRLRKNILKNLSVIE